MIIVSNKYIPFTPYTAMTVWPFVFVREDVLVSDLLLRHEAIHAAQQKELLVVGFFLAAILSVLGVGASSLAALPLYFYMYLVFYIRERRKTIDTTNGQEIAYRKNPFEREAYDNEDDAGYIAKRQPFAWRFYMRD